MTTETTAPRDGETLGAFVFRTWGYLPAGYGMWVYTAGYSAPRDVQRRCRSLTQALGVQVFAIRPDADGEWFPFVRERDTAALRASMAAPAWDASQTQDEAAHVAETVDELRRETTARPGAGEE